MDNIKKINLGKILIPAENIKTTDGGNVFFGFDEIEDVIEEYKEDGWKLPSLNEMEYFSNISKLGICKFRNGSYLMEDSTIRNFSYFSYDIKKLSEKKMKRLSR
jgi:hypothetical protein